ncbi:ADP-ribosylation factor family [Trypanosoma rangeli]|uniref:ADP-ribosylation factor family n=1 Tax=Trypanosoma rangeli TaxID=5698 RepID=A0A3R7NMH3_TRYRA|nr:ADP-ribosylation factor family [Trypanosoma rangeli]RNF04867.1 ADP-ribosylation factor family [Trypanosoma rangeli]|eukprot:RNF04867.1 ADP-ribosylation factor family [Trypanosoma rangeli]
MRLLAWILNWFRGLFWQLEMEVTLVGLQGAGKTTFLAAITEGKESVQLHDAIPTIGLNTRKVTRGNVSIKVWDIGGQPRFRGMWERYCRGVQSIVFIVDAADLSSFEEARHSLHDLLGRPSLAGIPLLILANKNDLEGACSAETVISELQLSKLAVDRETACYSVSAKSYTNIDVTLKWLMRYSKSFSST